MAILLTGVTGAVGHPLYQALVKAHQKVFCIVRNAHTRTDIDIPNECLFDGDITLPNCGLTSEQITHLKAANITKVLHLAGLVKFDHELKQQIWEANYQGTDHILSLGKQIEADEFHYVSTAYATQNHRNPYEESKFAAEKLVIESGLPHSIYRIGIVIGESKSGITNGFDGYYGFLSGLHEIANVFRKKYNVADQIDLPVHLICSSTSTLNLVPADWLVDTLIDLVNAGCSGKTFHVVNPEPPLVSDVMKHGLEMLGIRGVGFVDSKQELLALTRHQDNFINIIQKGMSKVLTRYEPYVTHEEVFPLTVTVDVLGKDIVKRFPTTDHALLSTCFEYAAERQFGKIA